MDPEILDFEMNEMFLKPTVPFLVTNKVRCKINTKLLTQSPNILNFFSNILVPQLSKAQNLKIF